MQLRCRGRYCMCELEVSTGKEGINVTVLDNVLYNAESMEKVDGMTGIVLVERQDLRYTVRLQVSWHC